MVDPLSPFASVIRSLSSRHEIKTEPTERVRETHPRKAPDAKKRADAPSGSAAVLRARLRKRLRNVDPGDQDVEGSVFVETVLLWKFGEKLQGDPTFSEMVSSVVAQISSDDSLRQELTALIDDIRR